MLWGFIDAEAEFGVRIAISKGIQSGCVGEQLDGERRANGEFRENLSSKTAFSGSGN